MNKYICEKKIYIESYNGQISYQWDELSKNCKVVLRDKLEWGKKYILHIDKGCENLKGVDLKEQLSYIFYTYNPKYDFVITNTIPSNAQTIESNHNQQLIINFSNPIARQSIKDKITISPSIDYNYFISNDNKTISINFLDDLKYSTIYIVKIKKDIRSTYDNVLKEDYTFYFLTKSDYSNFNLCNASMKNSLGEMNLDFHYYSENIGIEKDMELYLDFSHDIYESVFSSNFNIEPSIGYDISKEKNGDYYRIKIKFQKNLNSETKYKVTIKKELKDIYDNSLDQQYQFFFTTDGTHSKRPLILKAENDSNTLISNNIPQINLIPLSAKQLNPKVIFSFILNFNHAINVFKSLDKIKLIYSAGYAVGTIEYEDYQWDSSSNTLTINFSIQPPSDNGTTYFSFTIDKGDDGLIDNDGNTLEKTISVQLYFTF